MPAPNPNAAALNRSSRFICSAAMLTFVRSRKLKTNNKNTNGRIRRLTRRMVCSSTARAGSSGAGGRRTAPLAAGPTAAGKRHRRLQRAQEIEHGLLLVRRQLAEASNHDVRLRRSVATRTCPVSVVAVACLREVRVDRVQQVVRAAVVEKEASLSHAPQRCRAEHVAGRVPLRDVV